MCKELVWWPGLNKDLETAACHANNRNKTKTGNGWDPTPHIACEREDAVHYLGSTEKMD
jgi:hypothetical protein